MNLIFLFLYSTIIGLTNGMKRAASNQVVLHHNSISDLAFIDSAILLFTDALSRQSPEYLLDLVRLPNLLEILEKTNKGHYLYLQLKHHFCPEVRFLVAIYSHALNEINVLVKIIPKETLCQNLVYMMEGLENSALNWILNSNSVFFADIMTELAEKSDYCIGKLYKRVLSSEATAFIDQLLTKSNVHLYALGGAFFWCINTVSSPDIYAILKIHIKKIMYEEQDEVKKVNAMNIILRELLQAKCMILFKMIVSNWDHFYKLKDTRLLPLLAEYASYQQIRDIVLHFDGEEEEAAYTPAFHADDRSYIPEQHDYSSLAIAYKANNIRSLSWLQELTDSKSIAEFYRSIFQNTSIMEQQNFLIAMATTDLGVLTEGCDHELDKNMLRYGSLDILNYHFDRVADFSGFTFAVVDAASSMPARNLKCFLDHEKFSTFVEDQTSILNAAYETNRDDLITVMAEHQNYAFTFQDIISAAGKLNLVALRAYLDRNVIMRTLEDVLFTLIPSIENHWEETTRGEINPETEAARNEIRKLVDLHLSFVGGNEVNDPLFGSINNAIQLALAFQTNDAREVFHDIIFTIFPELCLIKDKRLKLQSIITCLRKKAKKDELLQFMSETMSSVQILRVLRQLVAYEGDDSFLSIIQDPILKAKLYRILY